MPGAAGAGLVVDPDGALDEVGAEHVGQALLERGQRVAAALAAPPLLDQLALVPDGKANVGPCQRVPAHRFDAVREFGGVGLEELAPCRRAEEQLLDLDRGAGAARHGLEFAAAAVEPPGVLDIGDARQDGAVGDRIDGGQRLAAKTHGANRFEVEQAGDLAGGVALERDRQLFAQDARAVVLHRDQAHAAGKEAHRDLGGAGVQRVVDQFAHHRGRPLDDLAGGDLADQFIGQLKDGAAGGRGGDGVHRAILDFSWSCKARHCSLPVADFGNASTSSTMRGAL